jgi:FkbM family methyltransferase
MWALYVAKLGFEVHAFEPSPLPYATLYESAKKYLNLHTYQCALGDCNSTIKLNISKFFSMGIVRGHDEENTVTVPIRKLDDFQLANVGVIKIDTEGYEVPILNGAKDTILKWKPRLVVEVHRVTGKALETYTEEQYRIEKLLRNYGYSCKVARSSKSEEPFVIGT